MTKSTHHQCYRFRSCGFTLVELIVVIFIIAVLMAFLIPVAGGVRERAFAVHCKNNLKQYGVALNTAFSDWNGYFFMPLTSANGVGNAGAGSSPGGGAVYIVEEGGYVPIGDYEGGISRDASAGSQLYQFNGTYFGNFLSYLPVGSGTETNSVRKCPNADLGVFDRNSPNYKGYYTGAGGGNVTNFYDWGSAYGSYGYNGAKAGQKRDTISANILAFSDANVMEGWGRNVFRCTNQSTYCTTWPVSYMTMGSNVQQRYQQMGAIQGVPRTSYFYQTEIGYYHKESTNRFANYTAMDGSVHQFDYNSSLSFATNLFLGL